MKTTWKNLLMLLLPLAMLNLGACDDDAPEEENDPEVITTVKLTFTPTAGGAASVFQAKDADGDGPGSIVIDQILLTPNTAYDVAISFLNELESPAEDITEEVEEEGDEHQIFYVWSAGALSSFAYNDLDSKGLPVGIKTKITTGTGGSRSLKVTLKHQPDGIKKATSTAVDGETDLEVTFNVFITL